MTHPHPHQGHPPGSTGPKPPARLARGLAALLTLVVLATGVGVAVLFFLTRPEPEKETKESTPPLVTVVTAKGGRQSVNMRLNGEVKPARRVVVMPEVGGKIVWQHPELVPGGFVEEGETILRIDPREYALSLKQQKSQLAQQRLNLKMEQARHRVAEEEWKLYEDRREKAGLDSTPGDEASNAPLALREPHLESAEVAVSSAESSIAQARLRLSRTVLDAPFNAVVQSESVDEGQLVSPSMQLATLVGTDTFWVQVSVPMDKVGYIRFPDEGRPGSRAAVWLDRDGSGARRQGEVIRLLGDLDPVGRLARVLVAVDDPMLLSEDAEQSLDVDGEAHPSRRPLPLLIGSYVHVAIDGVELDDVVEIPREALQENGRVFVVTDAQELAIEEVDVVWGNDDTLLVSGPVAGGDRLVTTNLQTAVEGMKLRIVGDDTATGETPEATKAQNGGEAATNGNESPTGDEPTSAASPAKVDTDESNPN